jgi:hypothetical protein
MPDARSIRRAAVAASALMTCAAAAMADGGPRRALGGTAPVTDTAPVARTLRLYAVDAARLECGPFAGPEGERDRAGRRLTSAVGRLVLEPGKSRRVRVALRVPVGALMIAVTPTGVAARR